LNFRLLTGDNIKFNGGNAGIFLPLIFRTIILYIQPKGPVMKTIISTPRAPAAIGPYSQAVKSGNLLFVSGQIPLNPATGKVEETAIEGQTRQVCENLRAVLEAAGSNLKIGRASWRERVFVHV
jgi:hypothetical protein